MIEVKRLTKYYGPKPAISDVSFSVEKGEVVGFLGPNAAGKTTTMRILTGFFPATSGSARISGFDTFSDSLEVRRRVGYLPESVPIYTEMRTMKYLEFVAEVKGIARKHRKTHIGRIVEECGLEGVENQFIRSLSRGYRQRVGLAQALINDPEVLILDEPTVGLDPKQIVEIRQLIRQLGENRTIILSSHILPEVSITCSRIIIINKGKIIAQETPENLTGQLEKYREIEMEVEGPPDDVREAIERVNGVSEVIVKNTEGTSSATYMVKTSKEKDIRRDLSRLVIERKWDLLELRTLSLSLEEVFVRMVTADHPGQEGAEDL